MKIRFQLSLLVFFCFFPAALTSAQTPQNAATDPLANEVSALRQSLQTLSNRLKVLSDELFSPDKKNEDKSLDSVKKVTTGLDLLAHAEERAEVLRKQLIELIEKETVYKTRMGQFDEDLRPENIERSTIGLGGTRTAELRDTRRRGLETEKRGIENLLNVTTQSRMRLEEDVRQADLLVTRLRQRLLPIIEKEIDKINPPE